MKTIEQTRRELFEADFKIRRKSTFPAIELSRDSGSGYKYNPAHSDWMAFNAALDAVVIELPKACAYETLDSTRVFVQLTYEISGDSADQVALVRISDCRAAIESTNLGLKIR